MPVSTRGDPTVAQSRYGTAGVACSFATMTNPTETYAAPTTRRGKRLPMLAILGLAALGLPRVILHDLHLTAPQSLLTWILALAPVAAWILAAVLSRSPRPLLDLVLVGLAFGAMLALTHQILWEQAFAGAPPALGSGPAGSIVPRIAAVFSGLTIGTAMGAVSGVVALGLARLTGRSLRA